MLDWNDLRHLLAVARQGSTLAAAKSLRVHQSTVHRRIVALENALGCDLVERHPTGYRLTEIGAPISLQRVRTLPAPRPLLALDRLWSIPFDHLESLEAFSTDGARWASDHLPLVAMIRPTRPLQRK
jgi:hypothetical protein